MGVGTFLEPLIVIALLFGGAFINRNRSYSLFGSASSPSSRPRPQPLDSPVKRERSPSPDGRRAPAPPADHAAVEEGLLGHVQTPAWRAREVRLFGLAVTLASPNTEVFEGRFLSRVLVKFPFLVEAWYWALIYFVYQSARGLTAVNLEESTVDLARRHALQVVRAEQALGIFWEPRIQAGFLRHDLLMQCINRIYSFIHIPGTILFLVLLYHYTTVRNRPHERRAYKEVGEVDGSPAGPMLYEARRRTMATCNLLAFIVFTAWPCMPPRLLGASTDPENGGGGPNGKPWTFIDTVHSSKGASSVWTQNKFCNQFAAMPSLHFGYALMIGLTVSMLPLSSKHRRSRSIGIPYLRRLRLPWVRVLCVALGAAYAATILVAIVSTANHFILDAVAGACVCCLGWWSNGVLLNLLWLEDYFLWCVRIHKPSQHVVEEGGAHMTHTFAGKSRHWRTSSPESSSASPHSRHPA